MGVSFCRGRETLLRLRCRDLRELCAKAPDKKKHTHLAGFFAHLLCRRSPFWLGLLLLVIFIPIAHPASDPDPAAELRRQQEREEQLHRKNRPEPDVRLQVTLDDEADRRLPPKETPCFRIDKITLQTLDAEGQVTGQNPFPWAAEAANYTDKHELDTTVERCLGAAGINLVMKRIQNAIVSKGYVTTRVLAAPQNLKTGELKLTVIPGRIRDIRFKTPSPRTTAWNAIPHRANQLLYLRDIEQGLENFKRVPSVEADIRIYPSEAPDARPGDSDLVVDWKQDFPFRFNLSLDNSGSESTGKYQGAFTFSYDNWLALNDLFYVSLNNDLGGGSSGPRGTRGHTFHYSVPYGYWLLGFTTSQSHYYQTVAGASQDYVYSGDSKNAEIKLSHMLDRDARRKTQWYLAGWTRASENYIDDTEVEVQRRRMAGWELGINHKEYIDRATLELDVMYRRGTGAMGALRAPEEDFDEGASRPRIVGFDASLTVPFSVLKQQVEYKGALRTQWNQTPLAPQDRFSIGSRYTVRGFDGESTLSGDRGWVTRNDLSMGLGSSGQAVYLGMDYGAVDGPSSEGLVGKRLSGVAFGFKGNFKGLGYDACLATPLKKPDGFVSDDTVFNFSLNWGF